ncbi:hypothetical protein NLU13_0397 [Sarocladium strictum]|uniref:Tetraspanin n=1 Tax=Sarocladium strictum TaxID=5046 RepID=A0AA39GQV9_SARSR|nr:hypothetical protein NLU13_0397 [Sarocladium strictum]
MVNKILATTMATHFVFLATGCLSLGFCLIVRNIMTQTPTNGEEATRNLLYMEFPLNAGIANGAFIIVTFVASLPGLLMPMRGWLKASGYMITVCGLFTLCIGVYLWIMTLNMRENFFSVYVDQDPSVQDLIQTRFECCGYINSTTPAFVTDRVCPSPAASALLRGCATAIATFSNTLLDTIFTAVFGCVGVDAILILCIACLAKDRKERERYRHIDEKTGYRQI